jgi:hypothetical protein
MKRSGNVGLVLMGGAVFAATFAAGSAYLAWQKPSHAAQPQTAAAAAAAPAQNCTTRPDGTRNCEPARRSFAYYLFPSFGSSSASSAPDPKARTQTAALTSNSRTYSPAIESGTTRGGFGTTAQSGSYRVSAGG